MVRPITDTLRHLEAGCLIDDASEKLAELAKGHMTAKAAAALFGVSWHVVRNIWGGKSWGCING